MNTKNTLLRSVFFLVGTVFLLAFLQACRYRPPSEDLCGIVDSLTPTSASEQTPIVVFEELGTVKVMEGSGCAHLGKDKGIYLKVEQSIELPDYANKAAVFLNGWQLKYSGGDHHVMAVATALGKVKFERRKLTWNAVGVLGDDGRDKAIDWCDHFTVIAWNDAKLHAFVDQGDAEFFCKSGGAAGAVDTFFFADNRATTTALSCFSSFLFNGNFTSGTTVAVLPRGFALNWSNVRDHHLLQIAYNLEHSEPFIQSKPYKKAFGELSPLPTPPTGRAGSGFVSWNTCAIYKDNDSRRDYNVGELVSAMGGPDVGVIQPPFSILPGKSMGLFGACLGESAGVKTEEFIIDNIPYACAIPMLTGWDLGYPCNDHHVREIGIWIDDLHYDRAPNAPTGTLRYKLSSVLHDDSNNGHSYRHKVTILGLRPLVGVPVKQPVP